MILCFSILLSSVGCDAVANNSQTESGSFATDSGAAGAQTDALGTLSQTVTESQTESQTQLLTQTESQTSSQTQTETDFFLDTELQIATQTVPDIHIESLTQPVTETQTEIQTESETQTEAEIETEIQTQTDKPTEKPTEKQTEKQTQKQTENKGVSFRLKFASYNIFHAEKAGYDVSKIAKNITDNGIEVVGFQEVDQNTRRSGRLDTMKKLSEATGYKYYAFFKAISFDGGEYGVGILSKYPIESTGSIKLTSGDEQRVLGRATIVKNNTKINFFVTHLSYDGEDGTNSNTRKTQFAQIAAELKKYDNFVLSGDFNTRNLDEYDVIAGSALVNGKDNPQITYPDGRSPLDNLVYSTNVWTFGTPKIVTNSYSDHYMIYSQALYKSKN